MTQPVQIISGADVADHPTSDPQEIADRAVAAIKDYCGWHVAPVREETVEVETDGSGIVFLPTLRIESVSAVSVDGEPATFSRSDWSVRGWLQVSAAAGAVVSVTMRHGYAVTPSLRAAALALAASSSADGRVVSSQRLGDRSVNYYAPGETSSAPGDVRATLDRYRLPARP